MHSPWAGRRWPWAGLRRPWSAPETPAVAGLLAAWIAAAPTPSAVADSSRPAGRRRMLAMAPKRRKGSARAGSSSRASAHSTLHVRSPGYPSGSCPPLDLRLTSCYAPRRLSSTASSFSSCLWRSRACLHMLPHRWRGCRGRSAASPTRGCTRGSPPPRCSWWWWWWSPSLWTGRMLGLYQRPASWPLLPSQSFVRPLGQHRQLVPAQLLPARPKLERGGNAWDRW
mmetsp:Transcript_60910/g.171673  ORF Transcript_60910/g.171673 Transcript_60910/m.171673 type:complete len:226 (-) Transcript_60910:381-1058(-)